MTENNDLMHTTVTYPGSYFVLMLFLLLPATSLHCVMHGNITMLGLSQQHAYLAINNLLWEL